LFVGAATTVSTARLFILDLAGADPLVRLILTAAAIAFGAISFLAAYGIYQRKRYGRLLSLIINYVGFVLFLMVSFQGLGIFNGVTTLADNIEASAGYAFAYAVLVIVYSQLGRLPEAVRGVTMRVGGIAVLVFGVLLLLQLGLIGSLIGALGLVPAMLPYLSLTLLFGVMAWLMFRPTAATVFGETLATREAIVGLLFLSPNLLGFLIFFAGPLILSLFLSFTQYELFTPPEWRGLQNYGQILGLSAGFVDTPDANGSQAILATHQELARLTVAGRTLVIGASDPTFWTALRNTIAWVILIVPFSIIPALGLALLLNARIKGIGYFRPLFFLPVVAGVVGVSLIWVWLYNPDIGAFNSLIGSVVETVNRLAGRALLTNPKVQWTLHQDSALFSIAVMAAWMSIGYNMVIFLTGLQNIPRVLYEAARVDGATGVRAFFAITLPMLAPTTFFVVTTTLINAFQVFTEPYVMGFNNGRGPGNSTVTGVIYLYNTGFSSSNHMGYASAIAWVLVIIIFLITLAQFRASERFSNAA
jgi:ABC-type sugar transport system permease subunit